MCDGASVKSDVKTVMRDGVSLLVMSEDEGI